MVVIGCGVGGLAAGVELAGRGLEVLLLERGSSAGGKLSRLAVGGRWLDAGPTVLTMPWVFEGIFQRAGASFREEVPLLPCEILARHRWPDGSTLDLFADPARTEAAIAAFAGSGEAAGYRTFCSYAQRIYETVEGPFLRAQRPGLAGMLGTAGLRLLAQLRTIDAWRSMWRALGEHFRDPRLRQLFGRYATYTGSSPFLAPATLNLVAHVESRGVWRVEGGMHRLAAALQALALRRGAGIRTGAEVARIVVEGGRVRAVELADGERIPCDAVVCNGDAAALAAGRFGPEAGAGLRPVEPAARSLSAVVQLALARTEGFSLHHHNVFFGGDSEREFRELFADRILPTDPTVYVCAQDRGDGVPPPEGPERLLVLVNAPAAGDGAGFSDSEMAACRERTGRALARAGLSLQVEAETVVTPADFAARFPATGGALYGRASHGWDAAFLRPGGRTRTAGLYLAGGSVHPGAGVPMAALSGQLAAEALQEDLRSTHRWSPAATPGGTSTG